MYAKCFVRSFVFPGEYSFVWIYFERGKVSLHAVSIYMQFSIVITAHSDDFNALSLSISFSQLRFQFHLYPQFYASLFHSIATHTHTLLALMHLLGKKVQ